MIDGQLDYILTSPSLSLRLCSSYPKVFIVPQSVTDSNLLQVSKFRSLSRIPAVVWRSVILVSQFLLLLCILIIMIVQRMYSLLN